MKIDSKVTYIIPLTQLSEKSKAIDTKIRSVPAGCRGGAGSGL